MRTRKNPNYAPTFPLVARTFYLAYNIESQALSSERQQKKDHGAIRSEHSSSIKKKYHIQDHQEVVNTEHMEQMAKGERMDKIIEMAIDAQFQ